MVFHPAKNGACESFQRQRSDMGRQTDLCNRKGCDRPRSDHAFASEVSVAPLSTDERLVAIEARLSEVERTLRIHDRSIDFRVGGSE